MKRRCSASVFRGAMRTGQCSKTATVFRDGRHWCTVHDPNFIANKRAERLQQFDADRLKMRARLAAEAFCCGVEIEEFVRSGHNLRQIIASLKEVLATVDAEQQFNESNRCDCVTPEDDCCFCVVRELAELTVTR